MYEAFFGLRERPFDLTPNPRFLFLSPGHRDALIHLQYGLRRPGITMLTGDAGTGKTTLIRAAMQSIQDGNTSVIQLSNPSLTRSEFYEHLADGFGFGEEAAHSKTRFLRQLEVALSKVGTALALLVDEAQALPHELLEEIRLLSNTEGAGGATLAIVLVGQLELAARFNAPSLRQLKQRIVLRCELGRLNLKESAAYISARVSKAGGRAEQLFTQGAVIEVHRHSTGIPRIMSVICDNALISGFASNLRPVNATVISEVCAELEFVAPEAHQEGAQSAAHVL